MCYLKNIDVHVIEGRAYNLCTYVHITDTGLKIGNYSWSAIY